MFIKVFIRTYGCQGRGGEEWEEGQLRQSGMDMYTLPYLERITNKILLHSTGNTSQCPVTDRMGGAVRGDWIHEYVWLCPFAVHLKLSVSKHCYSIVLLQLSAILQYKIKSLKEIKNNKNVYKWPCLILGLYLDLS